MKRFVLLKEVYSAEEVSGIIASLVDDDYVLSYKEHRGKHEQSF